MTLLTLLPGPNRGHILTTRNGIFTVVPFNRLLDPGRGTRIFDTGYEIFRSGTQGC